MSKNINFINAKSTQLSIQKAFGYQIVLQNFGSVSLVTVNTCTHPVCQAAIPIHFRLWSQLYVCIMSIGIVLNRLPNSSDHSSNYFGHKHFRIYWIIGFYASFEWTIVKYCKIYILQECKRKSICFAFSKLLWTFFVCFVSFGNLCIVGSHSIGVVFFLLLLSCEWWWLYLFVWSLYKPLISFNYFACKTHTHRSVFSIQCEKTEKQK